jgi:hypothetical protein
MRGGTLRSWPDDLAIDLISQSPALFTMNAVHLLASFACVFSACSAPKPSPMRMPPGKSEWTDFSDAHPVKPTAKTLAGCTTAPEVFATLSILISSGQIKKGQTTLKEFLRLVAPVQVYQRRTATTIVATFPVYIAPSWLDPETLFINGFDPPYYPFVPRWRVIAVFRKESGSERLAHLKFDFAQDREEVP